MAQKAESACFKCKGPIFIHKYPTRSSPRSMSNTVSKQKHEQKINEDNNRTYFYVFYKLGKTLGRQSCITQCKPEKTFLIIL